MQSKYKVKNRWNILQITAFLFSITIVDTKAKTLATTISRVSHGIMGYQGYHGDTLDKSVKSKKWKLLVLEGFLAPFGMWEFFKPSPPPLFKNSCITPLTLDYQDEDKPDILMMSSILIAVGFFFLGISNTIENREIKQLIIETQLIIKHSSKIIYSLQ